MNSFQTDYYPFGLEIQNISISDNLQFYNSKELQAEAKLDWYDYGARFYDPVLGRWHSVDPMAEIVPAWTPYRNALDNPVNYTDPNRMIEDWWVKFNSQESAERRSGSQSRLSWFFQ